MYIVYVLLFCSCWVFNSRRMCWFAEDQVTSNVHNIPVLSSIFLINSSNDVFSFSSFSCKAHQNHFSTMRDAITIFIFISLAKSKYFTSNSRSNYVQQALSLHWNTCKQTICQNNAGITYKCGVICIKLSLCISVVNILYIHMYKWYI